MEQPKRESGAILVFRPVWLYVAAWVFAACTGLRYFSFVTADPDLWGHIRFGENIWRLGALECTDPYSFTTPGTTWINHEWLTELLFFFFYQNFGDSGLLVGKLLIGIAVIVIIAAICRYRQQHPLVLVLVMVPAIISISPGFMIRPQLASYLLFTLFLFVLHLYFSSNDNRLWVLPPLMVLWVNLHGGFLMGIVLMGVVVGWQTLSALSTGNREKPLHYIWMVFCLTLLASLVNPYGYKLHSFLFNSLKIERAISEWAPVTLLDFSFPAFKLLMIAFIITALREYKKNNGWEIIGIVLMLYASIRHQRHIPFFAIMVSPYLVHRGSQWLQVLQLRFAQIKLSGTSKMILVLVLLLLSVHQAAAGIGTYVQARWRVVVDPNVYPVAAVRFMIQNGFKGNLLLPFEWGEYAIWKLHPQCLVSIDGRFRTTYPESVIQDHFQARKDARLLIQLAKKYPADIILARQSPSMQAVINRNTPGWLYIYSDSVAVIFLQDSARNRSLLTAFRNKKFVYGKQAPSPFFP